MDFSALKTFIYLYVSFISFICISEFVENVAGDELTEKMQKVKNKILNNYDSAIRPTNGTNTTEVQTDFMPRQILSLDEETAILTLDSFLYVGWLDPRLSWDVSDYDGYLTLPKEFIWVPDFSIHNSHSMQVDPTKEVLVGLFPSGFVVWVPPIMTQTTCPSVSNSPYPGDTVTCTIQYGSWMHDGWSIDFKHPEEMLMDNFEDIHPRWKLKKAHAVRNEMRYECCPEPYISISIFIELQRRPVPEIEATRAPCVLTMLLTLAIFWLPPDSSLKLLLGGILFLALNLLLVYVAWSTKYPLAVAFAVSFIQTTMYLVVSTILLQVFVVIKLGALSGPSRPPASIMHFLNGPLGRYACLRSPMSEDRLSLDRVQLKEDAPSAEDSPREEWKVFAAAIDRVLFVLMSVVMVAVHHL